jgi:hypothetical protein
MIKIRKWMIAGTLFVSLLIVGMTMAPVPSIDWWVIGGGGGSNTVGNISLDGTVGQWAVGSGTSGTTQLGSGFWGGGSAEGPPEAPANQIFLPAILRHHP